MPHRFSKRSNKTCSHWIPKSEESEWEREKLKFQRNVGTTAVIENLLCTHMCWLLFPLTLKAYARRAWIKSEYFVYFNENAESCDPLKNTWIKMRRPVTHILIERACVRGLICLPVRYIAVSSFYNADTQSKKRARVVNCLLSLQFLLFVFMQCIFLSLFCYFICLFFFFKNSIFFDNVKKESTTKQGNVIQKANDAKE